MTNDDIRLLGLPVHSQSEIKSVLEIKVENLEEKVKHLEKVIERLSDDLHELWSRASLDS